MQQPILSAQQVRETIRRAGVGESHTKKVKNVAGRISAGVRTLHVYQRDGAKKGTINFYLCQLAYEHGVLERSDDGGGVFLI